MIIPLSTDRPLRRAPIITPILLAGNLVVFGATVSVALRSGSGLSAGSESILRRFAFVWKGDEWWRWVSYAFLHSPTDWLHVLGNCLLLFVFGPSVEDRLGRAGFLLLYLGGAAAAATAHGWASPAPLIGASGAVAAITGAFLVFFPRTHIRVLILLVLVGVYQIPAMWLVALAVARDMMSVGARDSVSHAAHLGGYATGVVLGLMLLALRVVPRESVDLLSIFQHTRRKAEFRAAAEVAAQRRQRVRAPLAHEPPSQAPGNDAALAARAEVNARLGRQDLPGAAEAYRALLREHPDIATARTLSKNSQLTLANHLFEAGDHGTAVVAYRAFLSAFPRDPQAAHARLLVGLILARYLNDPTGARRELDAVRGQLEGEDSALADMLLAEIGAPRGTPVGSPAPGTPGPSAPPLGAAG